MRNSIRYYWLSTSLICAISGCSIGPVASADPGFGPRPELPSAHTSVIPTVNIAPVTARDPSTTPSSPAGFEVHAFATGLNHPRWLYTLPNGDVLVAESDAPAEHDEGSGIKGWIRKQVMKRAGAGVPSPDRIILLRDTNGDGLADSQTAFLTGLHSPFGMALIGDQFYVADTDALMRFPYTTGETRINSSGTKVLDFRPGPLTIIGPKTSLRSRREASVYHCWIEQQRRGKRHRGREGPRAHPRVRFENRSVARLRIRPAQPQWYLMAASQRRVVDSRERARRTRQ